MSCFLNYKVCVLQVAFLSNREMKVLRAARVKSASIIVVAARIVALRIIVLIRAASFVIVALVVVAVVAIGARRIVVEIVFATLRAHYAFALRAVVFRGLEEKNRNDYRRHGYADDENYAKSKRRVGDYVAFFGIGRGLAVDESVALRLRYRVIGHDEIFKRIARCKTEKRIAVKHRHNVDLR